MSRLQLNSKFVNNTLPEWGRFVTDVKLNRGLRDSNYDQLYAYLKQHEIHAQENKMMLERFSQPTVDPLALIAQHRLQLDSGLFEASHIRIKTTNQETNILPIVDGNPRTISESSLRRHLKLNYEEGISSLPNAEIFENFSLMGYNILPNQSNIATVVVCLATNRVYNFSKMIFDSMGEGSANPTEPHHTPSPQEHHSPLHDSPPPSHQTITSEPLPQAPTETLTPRRYWKRMRLKQDKSEQKQTKSGTKREA
nr:integrase, catalytic region, zinc finger, CCHC-type, peptidase aspartic, catalytic [Tanacetum cinerariifolium]